MLKYAQLHQRFDAEKMKAELFRLESKHWQLHYNKTHYEGEWTILPLRSLNGQADNIYSMQAAGNGVTSYADTPLLEGCPYLQTVLAFFACEKTSVRLMKLRGGAVIKEHRDTDLCYEDGEARLHIPILTNPQVSFWLDKEWLRLQEGECWYMNLSLRHRVHNAGTSDRVHLVIDCIVNDWLRNLLTEQVVKQKSMDAEEAPDYDLVAKQNMITELRRMNTPVSLALAAKLENELL